ncbi:MAG: branched-chain amino acid transport system II carrier protein [Flavobacteriaceae bacterium]|nr:branched-chain amino acid transport system II carrier protein [Bacteroidia bacterium]NNK87467.1 branched-chain amino acid transport system II carrier protein [Flavobacteriaceae bacterium]
MTNNKETFALGFGIFAAFFGAGNLILPPLLGFNAGPDWWLVAIGFVTSATIIPLMALFAHARLQGTMMDFGKKVSYAFALVFCLCVYTIAITLPCPRTAAVTHEMAIEPFFGSSALLTSSIYFALVLVFALNRNNVLQILGKYLTPLIAIILFAIILVGIISPPGSMQVSNFDNPILSGFFEGYQTYDAIAGLLTGGIVVISLNLKGYTSFAEKKRMIARSGLIAMAGLFFIYAGLIALGALYSDQYPREISRPELLSELSRSTLGNIGTTFLSVLVGLACFTTAVGIIVGTADYFKGLFNESRRVYFVTTLVACIMGVLIGQFDVRYIIDVALPALMFIYPLTIVLIFLNLIPETYASARVFRAVVLVTFVFSIPDFLGLLIDSEILNTITAEIPLADRNLGWVIPAILAFGITNLILKRK